MPTVFRPTFSTGPNDFRESGQESNGGNYSEAGSRLIERMLSVVVTCRQQNRNASELLTACCRVRLDGSDAGLGHLKGLGSLASLILSR